jgi:hypothetical protein
LLFSFFGDGLGCAEAVERPASHIMAALDAGGVLKGREIRHVW